MDSHSKELLDLLDLELLQTLLDKTPKTNSNHPFMVFLTEYDIGPGINKIDPTLLIALYKTTGGKMKGVTPSRVRSLCKGTIPIKDKMLLLNINDKQIKGRIKILQGKKDQYISAHIKKKFEFFIKENQSLLGSMRYDAAYQLYVSWSKKKRLSNPFTEFQFLSLCKLYFGV